MAGIDKEYFSLEEIEARWTVPGRDLVYLAENGLLKVSVRLYGVRLERGHYEKAGDGNWCHVPVERLWFQGLQHLRAHDVYRLFHEGRTKIDQFEAPCDRYCHVLQPEDGVVVGKEELVICREERDRAEAKHGLGGVPRATETIFEQKNDFAEVSLGCKTYALGPIQAQVVRVLYEAAANGAPWRHGKQVLAEAGSASTRIADVFKSQPDWRNLIQSNRRGKYCLNIKFS